ncbi:hypothetical protein WKI13_09210 [Teredinibacter turnerae]|uniref:hypothetical protein n=1 Tax=Teredinibacter turnerae TaxID=2426 RepID=UPI000360B6DD|nr:hypothetical protein [Teredinibacter turnerae]
MDFVRSNKGYTQAVGKSSKKSHSVVFRDNRPKASLPNKAVQLRAVSPIQLKGERAALTNTKDATRSAGEQIRRGNRRGSISDTGGRSRAKLAIEYDPPHEHLNTGYRSKVQELRNFVINKMVAEAGYIRTNAEALINNNDSFLQAKAVEEISVGNCGEFSMVVFAHLIQNTTGQWVHRCCMAGKVPGSNPPQNYDHCFVFTYAQQVADTKAIANKNEATIADAWDGYKILTLKSFMKGQNAYGTTLKDSNISIEESKQADGNQVFSNRIKGYITEWAVSFNQDFENDMLDPNSTYARVAADASANPSGFGTRGSDVAGLDDRRTIAQKLGNCTADERDDIIQTSSDDTLFGYINTLSHVKKAEFFVDLPTARIARYITKCWNSGFWQTFAVASSYPYRHSVINALPRDMARDVLDALPKADKDKILKALPKNKREQLKEPELPV